MTSRFTHKLTFCLFMIACSSYCTAPNSNEQEIQDMVAYFEGTSFKDKVRIPVSAYDSLDRSKLPEIRFENPVFNFDTIQQGDIIEHIFSFVNTGNSDLYIIDAKPSCGCTTSKISKEAIPPGESGEISVTFDSTNKTYNQEKNIIIISNTYPNETTISMTGYVSK